jgi:hypothetical protein
MDQTAELQTAALIIDLLRQLLRREEQARRPKVQTQAWPGATRQRPIGDVPMCGAGGYPAAF